MSSILFLGTHGQKNWGDELLLHVFMNQLRGTADTFYVNSYDPKLTAAYLDRPDVTVFHTKTDRLKLLACLLRCDALVFGGGNILKELYTAYGGSRYGTLSAIDSLTKAASLLGKPIYMCNIGIGPLDTEQGRRLTKRIVQRARLTTVRDSGSYQSLQALQVTTPHALTSDAVFAASRSYFGLPRIRPERRKDSLSHLRTVGINLCRNIAQDNNWHYFIQHLAQDLLGLHRQNPDIQFVGIPMQFGVASNDDTAALQELAALLHKNQPNIVFKIVNPTSWQQLVAVIDTLDILVAERLHALILAIIAGVPIVALEYDVKVTGLVADLGLQKYSVDINKKFEPGSILRIISLIYANYPKTVATVAAKYQAHHKQSALSFANLKQALS